MIHSPEQKEKEEWMILSDFHNSNVSFSQDSSKCDSFDLHQSCFNYTQQQLGEMHSWIKSNKEKFEQVSVNKRVLKIDMASFSEQQKLAYDIVHHSQSDMSDPLLLIINGVAGTGKSYLITAISSKLDERCVVTPTTGKAANII